MKRLYPTAPLLLIFLGAMTLSDRAEANMRSTLERAGSPERVEGWSSGGSLSLSVFPFPRHELALARHLTAAIGGARSFVFGMAALELDPAPSRFPLAGGCRASSPFGVRRHPVSGRRRFHRGLDVAADPGTPVLSSGHGMVVSAGRARGYGKMVVIDHGRGVKTRYAHLRRIHVREGQVVRRGDGIGGVGATGRATGPHLHFEVRVGGRPVDPMGFGLCRAD